MNLQNKKHHISLLLLTKNEEDNIKVNFNWLKKCPNINEIVVVDDFSTDSTISQLKKLANQNLKIKIFKRKLNNDFSQQRIFALSKTKNNRILWLDADETPGPQLIKFLTSYNFSSKNSFSFRRQDFFAGHKLKHGETAKLKFIRFFDKRYGLFEHPVHELWISRQPITFLPLFIYHHPHKNLSTFLQKINYYSDIRAQELYSQKIKINLLQIIFYPGIKLFQNYVLRLGFLDSTPGLIMALFMSLHSFLVRTKLWQKQ
ncbi:glycosyltransferase family 2 protein [Patescibacteria group bacterium]|nr:glycosyltransferase family 2 protein [Patescibacteria group bacterium]